MRKEENNDPEECCCQINIYIEDNDNLLQLLSSHLAASDNVDNVDDAIDDVFASCICGVDDDWSRRNCRS